MGTLEAAPLTVRCNLCNVGVSAPSTTAADEWMAAHREQFHPHAELEAKALTLLDRATNQALVPMIREHLQRELATHRSDAGLKAFIAYAELNLAART